MKHLRKNRKFGRLADYRKTFLWNLVNNLILKERIRTTKTRAKEIRKIVERAISRAKKDTVSNRRLLSKKLEPKAVVKLFKDIAPKYVSRNGGYTKVFKINTRKNDAAEMVLIEFVK
jgi:large subunit ribosomal protein L17